MMRADSISGYGYEEPKYEEVSHEGDPFCSVSEEAYGSFLECFRYGMRAAEEFLRRQFKIDETVLCRELDRYREHTIEFTWMNLREDPEYYFLERYRAGELDAVLLPAKEGDWFYRDIEYTLMNFPGYAEEE